MHGAARRDGPVAIVQHLVADEERELILQASFLAAQTPVDKYRSRRFESGSDQRTAGQLTTPRLFVEPLDLQPVTFADRHERIEDERHLATAAFLGGPPDIGEIVVTRFL